MVLALVSTSIVVYWFARSHIAAIVSLKEMRNATAVACCAEDCTLESVEVICRPRRDVCDIPETCDGASAECPVDVLSTDECRSAMGDCDLRGGV